MLKIPFAVPILGCCFLVALSSTNVLAQRNRKSKPPTIQEVETKADELESTYYQTCKTAKGELLSGIDGFIKYVDSAPGFAIDVRFSIKEELRRAKDAFEKDNRFTAIPALQGVYQRFAAKINPKYFGALDGFEKLRVVLPSGDARLAVIENRVTSITDHFAAFDSLKPKSVWVGHRCDFQMPPHLEINPAKFGRPDMFKVVQVAPGNFEFSLKVEKRNGREFEGVVSQNGGRFKAKVRGIYDGYKLQMEMVELIKGAPREFRYAGTLVGGSALLGMEGLSSANRFTQGAIFMTLK